MPDFERVTRSLELHLASTPEAKSFIAGKHAGLDRARKQMLVVVVLVLVSALTSLATVLPPLKGPL